MRVLVRYRLYIPVRRLSWCGEVYLGGVLIIIFVLGSRLAHWHGGARLARRRLRHLSGIRGRSGKNWREGRERRETRVQATGVFYLYY